MRNQLMSAAARVFPTHHMGEQRWLAGLWRVLFYAIGPTEPFRFRTRDYEMFAVPQKWHLSRSVIRKGSWEPYITDLFRSHLRPGMTVVDVGANYGHYALTAANAVGRDGIVLAFEPQPGVCADLRRNATLLPGDNLRVFAMALGDRDGEALMTVDRSTSGWSSLVAELVPSPGHPIRVPVRRLRDVLAEVAPHRKVGLMKVDVEGFEAQVFRGAWEVVEEHRPVIFTEFSPARMQRAGENAGALLDRLCALGYHASVIDEKSFRLVPALPPVESWVARYGAHLNNVDAEDWFVNLVLEAKGNVP